MANQIGQTRHSWEFRIEATEMGKIFPHDGFVSLLFETAEQAERFMENYPSFRHMKRSYTVIQHSEYANRLDIKGPTGVVKTIDALKEAIDASTFWDDEIGQPYHYTYFTNQ